MPIDKTQLIDGQFFQLAADLSDCLCQALAEAGGPSLCFCGVMPGNVVDFGLAMGGKCDGGMAWVRISQIFPSTVFPEPDTDTAHCSTLLAAVIEVGVSRPVILGTDKRNPTLDELTWATRLQLSDMSAMRRAIRCCVAGSNVDFTYLMGDYAPDGPDGGLLGGTWTLTVQESF